MERRAPAIEPLLAQSDRVRGLARRLVFDAARRDDAVQQAWLEALERPPRHAGNLRAWLGDALRSAARDAARGDARRAARERAAARAEAQPGAAELVEQAETQRALVGMVLELDPRQRDVLLLRFFRDLPPRRIARALGLPVETVKTRLARGLAQLRARLEREHGGREAWLRAVLPLAVLARGGARGVGLAAALGGLLCAAAALAVWRPWGGPAPDPRHPAPPARVALRGPAPAASGPAASAPRTAAAAGRAPMDAAPAASAAGPAPPQLLGRVVDEAGRPLAGVRVRQADPQGLRWADAAEDLVVGVDFVLPVAPALRATLRADPAALEAFCAREFTLPAVGRALLCGQAPRLPAATSDAAGRFALAVERAVASFAIEDPGRALYAVARADGGPGEALLVAAPARTLRGHVVDAGGAPVAGARVVLRARPDALLGAPEGAAWELSTRTFTAQSDAAGAFAIARAPDLGAGLELCAERGALRSSSVRPRGEPLSAQTLTLTLDGPAARLRVRGAVLLPDGRPAAGARVRLGGVAARADSQGRYALEPAPADGDAPAELLAALPGYAPARLSGIAALLVGAAGERALPTLRLGATPLSIEGRVVTPDGAPVARARLRLLDGAPFAPGACLEDWAAGRARGFVEADAQGRFTVGGLEPRSYALLVQDGPDTLASAPLPAGARGVELALARVPRAALRGRVVGLDGAPLAGVTLALEPPRPGVDWEGRVAASGADGGFALEGAPRAGARVTAAGGGVAEAAFELVPGPAHELALARLVGVRLEGPAPAADALRVTDAAGGVLPLVRRFGGASWSGARLAPEDGRFPGFEVSERAAALELLRGGERVLRRPLSLRPGRPAVVRLR